MGHSVFLIHQMKKMSGLTHFDLGMCINLHALKDYLSKRSRKMTICIQGLETEDEVLLLARKYLSTEPYHYIRQFN